MTSHRALTYQRDIGSLVYSDCVCTVCSAPDTFASTGSRTILVWLDKLQQQQQQQRGWLELIQQSIYFQCRKLTWYLWQCCCGPVNVYCGYGDYVLWLQSCVQYGTRRPITHWYAWHASLIGITVLVYRSQREKIELTKQPQQERICGVFV